MKYLLFRDLDNESNLSEDKTFHASGIVTKVFNEDETSSGKDLSVTFFSPFVGVFINAWRTYSEVQLFEISQNEWESLKENYKL